MAQVQYYGTGRRKSSVARVRLVPGEGRIIVNNREISEHIPSAALIEDIKQPLNLTETAGTYDVLVNVHGGGLSGQSGAIRHGIARALLEADPEYRSTLKRAGLLTRDARMKERKNTDLKAHAVHLSSQNVNLWRFKGSQDFCLGGLFIAAVLHMKRIPEHGSSPAPRRIFVRCDVFHGRSNALKCRLVYRYLLTKTF